MRKSRSSPGMLVYILALSLVFVSAEGCPAAQANETRTRLRAVSWQFNDGQQVHTIHGIAAEGISLDETNAEGPRAVRVLLMPVGWTAQPNHADARLEFTIGRQTPASGTHQVIDIEYGAALVELEPASQTRKTAVVSEMRRAALAAVNRDGPDPKLPVPQLAESFQDAVERFVKNKQDADTALSAQDVIRRAEDQEIYAAFLSFWPMIITRSITAGAEGTDALVLALPDENGTQDEFTCFSKFLGGSNFRLTSANGTFPALNAGDHLRISITQTPGDPIQIDPGLPINTDPPILSWAHQVLCQGWTQVFGQGQCPSSDEDSQSEAENSAR